MKEQTRRQETGDRRQKTRRKYSYLLPPSSFLLFILFLLLSTSYLLPPTFAQETSEQLQNLEQYIQNSQAKLLEYQQQISSIDAELGNMVGDFEEQITQRDTINAEIQELRKKNDVLREQIAESETQLAATEEQFAQLGETIEQLRSKVQELLISLYKDPSNRFARVLTNAESFHDLRVQNYFLSLLSDQHVQIINDLNSAVLELNTLQEQQSQIVATLDTQITEHEVGEAILNSKRGEVEAIMAELDSTREGRLATQRALYDEADRLEDAIGDLQRDREAEIQRLQAEAEEKRRKAALAATQVEQDQLNQEASDAEARASNLAAPPPALAEGFISPLDSLSIEAKFGVVGKGIVLRAATQGAAVKAVQPGNIIQVQYLGANDGYLVVIQHADGLTTAYASLQDNPPVQIGQQVTQGAVIGYVGGGLQPDTLKFYTRIEKNGQGTYVDPAELLGL
jgi:murein DD-endopeptidase MepM/ murein hydrolase activator NlpD